MKKKLVKLFVILLVCFLLALVWKVVDIIVWTQNANKNFVNFTLTGQLFDVNGKEIRKQGNVFITKYVGSEDFDLDPYAEQQTEIVKIDSDGKINHTFLPLQGMVIDSVVVVGYKFVADDKKLDFNVRKDYDSVHMTFALKKNDE